MKSPIVNRATSTPEVRALALFLCIGLSACASAISTPRLSATLVDSRTEEPIEGAHVVYRASAYAGTLSGHGGAVKNILLVEGLTDGQGRFVRPSQRVNAEPFPLNSNYNQAQVLFFKSGYIPMVDHNNVATLPNSTEALEWSNNGRTIALSMLTETASSAQEYARFNEAMDAIANVDCGWRNIPRLLLDLDREASILDNRRVRSGAPQPEIWSLKRLVAAPDCGSVENLLAPYRALPGAPTREAPYSLSSAEALHIALPRFDQLLRDQGWRAQQFEPFAATLINGAWHINGVAPAGYRGPLISVQIGAQDRSIKVFMSSPAPDSVYASSPGRKK